MVEVNLFCGEPLGVVTVAVRYLQEAANEVGKLLKPVEIVSSKYDGRPALAIFSVGHASQEAEG